MNTMLLIHNAGALAALRWACHLAQRMRGELHVVVLTTDSMTGLQRASAGSEENPELLEQVFAAIADAELDPVTVHDCRGYRLRRAALNAIAELDAELLILHGSVSGDRRSDRSLVRELARAAPLDVLILDVQAASERPGRVLFAQLRGSGAHGMRFALRAFCDEAHPLLVVPDPEAEARSRRVLTRVLNDVGRQRARSLHALDPPESIDALIKAEVVAGDLVLVDSEDSSRVGGRLAHLEKLRDEQPDARFSIGVTRANDLAGPGMVERMLERFHRHFPKLDRDSRRRIATDLERGGRASADFLMMLMLSAGIAALGLVQNSTAVVIGGMLVAPLMTPLLAIGLALVQGNVQQIRESFRAMTLGVGGAMLVAMIVGLLSPWEDLSAEVVARGAPNLFDLGIAALSGIAAAYALARPGLAGTLVGVAVAVALVPPLCAAGIALVKSHFDIAIGAAVLFITNLLAIVLGAALVFRLFGLDISLQGRQAPRWVRVTLLAFGLALLPVGGVLFANLESQIHDGVQRSYSRPLPPALREAIRARVLASPGVDILLMEQSGIEKGFDMHVALVVHGDPDPSLEQDLRRLIADRIGDRRQVSILMLNAVRPGAAGNVPQ